MLRRMASPKDGVIEHELGEFIVLMEIESHEH
jgi:hypothetical protein